MNHKNHPYSFDHADQSRSISGVYSTFKGIENSTFDFYYLYFDEEESSAALALHSPCLNH